MYRFFTGDWIEDWLNADNGTVTVSFPRYPQMRMVDTDKYDLVPKQGWIDEQIKLKEAQLKKLTEEHASRLKSLEDEISSLKGQKKALKTG